jgi:hypothetical protein
MPFSAAAGPPSPSRYGSENTCSIGLLLSGAISGVSRCMEFTTSEEPVATATYCLPSAANEIG